MWLVASQRSLSLVSVHFHVAAFRHSLVAAAAIVEQNNHKSMDIESNCVTSSSQEIYYLYKSFSLLLVKSK